MKYPVSSDKKHLLKLAQCRAEILQANYDVLGASPTQSLRNPVPMRVLVQKTLPVTSPTVIATVKVTATINGKRKSYSYKTVCPVGDFGLEPDAGLTVDELTDNIRSQGFLAKRLTVALTLARLAHEGLITKSRHTRPAKPGLKRKGKVSFCRYAMR